MALALAGCAPTTTAPWGIDLGDYEGPPSKLIAVDRVTDQQVIRLAGRYGSVGPVERKRLAAFITAVAGNRPDSLRVALHGRATAGQLRAVTNILAAEGVDPEHVRWTGWRAGPAVRAGTMMVVVERAVAVAPLCPGATGHISSPNDNLPEPNLGCANVSNLAEMVADPHELRQASGTIYGDGERAANNVLLYRADKSKPLLSTTVGAGAK
jgi:pilus assembly protein CpaD